MRQGNRDAGLDFVRICAMFAVMMIHVTSGYVSLPSSRTVLGMNLAYCLNQACRFSVPLFLLLSGLALGKIGNQTHTTPPESLQERHLSAYYVLSFYRRRIARLLPPYWFWSTVYFLFGRNFYLPSLASSAYVRSLLLGYAGPHLYFIVILFQCYLLFPLLRRWLDREAVSCLLLWFLAMVLSTQLILFRKLGLPLLPRESWAYLGIALPLWGFSFVLGLALSGDALACLRRYIGKHPAVFPAAWVLWGALCVVESRATGYLDTDRISLFLYAYLALPALLSLWELGRRCPLLPWSVTALTRHAATIYYCHVLILTLLRRTWAFPGTAGFIRLYGATALISLAAAWALDTLTARLVRFFRTAPGS